MSRPFPVRHYVAMEILRLKNAPAIRIEWEPGQWDEMRQSGVEGPAQIVPISPELMALIPDPPSVEALKEQIQRDFPLDYERHMAHWQARLDNEARLNPQP